MSVDPPCVVSVQRHPILTDEFFITTVSGIQWILCANHSGSSSSLPVHVHEEDGTASPSTRNSWKCLMLGDAQVPDWWSSANGQDSSSNNNNAVGASSWGEQQPLPSFGGGSHSGRGRNLSASLAPASHGGITTASISAERENRVAMFGLHDGTVLRATWSNASATREAALQKSSLLAGRRHPRHRTYPAQPFASPGAGVSAAPWLPVDATVDACITLHPQQCPLSSAFVGGASPSDVASGASLFAVGTDSGSLLLYDVSRSSSRLCATSRSGASGIGGWGGIGTWSEQQHDAESDLSPLCTHDLTGRVIQLEAVPQSMLTAVATALRPNDNARMGGSFLASTSGCFDGGSGHGATMLNVGPPFGTSPGVSLPPPILASTPVFTTVSSAARYGGNGPLLSASAPTTTQTAIACLNSGSFDSSSVAASAAPSAAAAAAFAGMSGSNSNNTLYSLQLRDLRVPSGSQGAAGGSGITFAYDVATAAGRRAQPSVSSSATGLRAAAATSASSTSASAHSHHLHTEKRVFAEKIAVHPIAPYIASCGSLRTRRRRRLEVVQVWDVRQTCMPVYQLVAASCAPHVSLQWNPNATSPVASLIGVTQRDVRLWSFDDVQYAGSSGTGSSQRKSGAGSATGGGAASGVGGAGDSGTEGGTEDGWVGTSSAPSTDSEAGRGLARGATARSSSNRKGGRSSLHHLHAATSASSVGTDSGGTAGVPSKESRVFIKGGRARILSTLSSAAATPAGNPVAFVRFLSTTPSSPPSPTSATLSANINHSGGGGAPVSSCASLLVHLGEYVAEPPIFIVDRGGLSALAPLQLSVLHSNSLELRQEDRSAKVSQSWQGQATHAAIHPSLSYSMPASSPTPRRRQVTSSAAVHAEDLSPKYELLSSGRNVWWQKLSTVGGDQYSQQPLFSALALRDPFHSSAASTSAQYIPSHHTLHTRHRANSTETMGPSANSSFAAVQNSSGNNNNTSFTPGGVADRSAMMTYSFHSKQGLPSKFSGGGGGLAGAAGAASPASSEQLSRRKHPLEWLAFVHSSSSATSNSNCSNSGNACGCGYGTWWHEEDVSVRMLRRIGARPVEASKAIHNGAAATSAFLPSGSTDDHDDSRGTAQQRRILRSVKNHNGFTPTRHTAMRSLLCLRELQSYFAFRYASMIHEAQGLGFLPHNPKSPPPGLIQLVQGACGASADPASHFGSCRPVATPAATSRSSGGGYYRCSMNLAEDSLRRFILQCAAWLPCETGFLDGVDNESVALAEATAQSPEHRVGNSSDSRTGAMRLGGGDDCSDDGARLCALDQAGATGSVAEAVERRAGIYLMLERYDDAASLLMHYREVDRSFAAIAALISTFAAGTSIPSVPSESTTTTPTASLSWTALLPLCGGAWMQMFLTALLWKVEQMEARDALSRVEARVERSPATAFATLTALCNGLGVINPPAQTGGGQTFNATALRLTQEEWLECAASCATVEERIQFLTRCVDRRERRIFSVLCPATEVLTDDLRHPSSAHASTRFSQPPPWCGSFDPSSFSPSFAHQSRCVAGSRTTAAGMHCSLPLMDRVALAAAILPSNEQLLEVLDAMLSEVVLSPLAPVIVGFGDLGIQALQEYVDTTADVQLPACLFAPYYSKQKTRWFLWNEAYETWLNEHGLFFPRAVHEANARVEQLAYLALSSSLASGALARKRSGTMSASTTPSTAAASAAKPRPPQQQTSSLSGTTGTLTTTSGPHAAAALTASSSAAAAPNATVIGVTAAPNPRRSADVRCSCGQGLHDSATIRGATGGPSLSGSTGGGGIMPRTLPPGGGGGGSASPAPEALKKLCPSDQCRQGQQPCCAVCVKRISARNVAASSAATPTREWFAWCTACLHGGHWHHLQRWFVKHKKCPVDDCTCECLFQLPAEQ